MILAEIPSRYSINFINNKVKPLLKNMIIDQVKKLPNKAVIEEHLKQFYNTSLSKTLELIPKSLNVLKEGDKYIIYTNNNIYYNNINVDTILRLIEFGNGDIKGSHIISQIRNKLPRQIFIIYLLSLQNRKIKKLWQ